MATYLAMLCCMVLAILSIPIVQAESISNAPELQIEKTSDNALRFRFYLQDRPREPNQTVWEVARAKITPNSKSSFGLVRVGDDPITTTPDPSSTKIGQAQGLLTFADLHESALHLSVNMYFTWKKFKGSSLSIMGRNALLEKDKELAIVGGTGVFRMARGYAISNTYLYDHGPVIEYEVFVYLHQYRQQQQLLALS